MARIFLAVVGLAYSVLAVWCSWLPTTTSNTVGFTLQPGSGQSEFLTVYGGLELALGLMFLWPLIRPSETGYTLFLCLLIHGCLVAFRTTAFVVFTGIPTTTYALAATEWVIFFGAAALSWKRRADSVR